MASKDRETSAKSEAEQLASAVEAVSAIHDADVLLFNSPIKRAIDTRFINLCCGARKRKNVFWIVITEGGSADAAYRMIRKLQDGYSEVICFVSGYCKSAGTLAAIGANRLIFGPHGELGPLDVQMSKRDDLFEMQSGQTVMSALEMLQEKAFMAFEDYFIAVQEKSFGRVSLKTATDIAVKLASSLFAPIYQQIDPMHVGEAGRASAIAAQYGQRLDDIAKNLKPKALGYLMSGYTSHGFVIDEAEARTLFRNVRAANEVELALCEALGEMAYSPLSKERTELRFLTSDILPESHNGKTGKGKSKPRGPLTGGVPSAPVRRAPSKSVNGTPVS